VGIYQKGQTVKLSVAFTNAAGAAANPTTVTCKVESPAGAETTYTTPTITNPSTGSFQLIIVADQMGGWRYRWEGTTGSNVAVDEGQFHCLGSAF
jgi:uncharacterized protein YfaS (alpha-2-macroglobulin family)